MSEVSDGASFLSLLIDLPDFRVLWVALLRVVATLMGMLKYFSSVFVTIDRTSVLKIVSKFRERLSTVGTSLKKKSTVNTDFLVKH